MKIVVGGRLVNYDEYNPQGKEVLVILPGWGHEAKLWAGAARGLQRNYWVIVPDLPGFGGSQPLAGENIDLPDFANWLGRFIKKMEIREYVLAGHSFGGQIAVYASATKLAVPKQLILISPALVRFNETALPLSIKLVRQFARFKRWLPKAWVNRISTTTDYAAASEGQKEVLKRIIRFDVSQMLPNIPYPTLGIWGEKDRETLGVPKELMSRLPKGRLRIIYNAGHNLHLEKPEELVRLAEHFLWQ